MSAIVETLKNTLQVAPENWTCRLALVEALCSENRHDEAIDVINQVETLPDDLAERTEAARAYGLLDPDSGMEVLNSILEEDATFGPAHFEKATLHLAAGDVKRARKHYFTATTFDSALEDEVFAACLDSTQPAATPAVSLVPIQVVEEPEPFVPEASAEPVAEYLPAEPVSQVVTPVPLQPPGERENLHYPAPGHIPVVTLRESMAAQGAQAAPRHLVTADAVPQPHINYINDAVYLTPAHTTQREFQEQLSNVSVHPHRYEEAVTYNYQAPDDSIFEHTVSPDDIYVSALVNEHGEAVASIQESIEWNRFQSKQKKRKAEISRKIQSFVIALGSMVVIAVLLGLVAISLPRPNPPQISAKFAPEISDDLDIEKKQMVQPRVSAPTPAPAMGAASMNAITATNLSDISMVTMETTSPGLGMADSGMGFGASMTFGTGGSEAMFFGSKTKGSLAVIFDITASMYGANPKVVKEINKVFKDAQVVAVYGATFKDMPDAKLMAYKKNKAVLKNVENNGKRSPETRDGMNEALFSLRNCDSLEAKSTGVQSLGRALELLLNQSLNRRPQTIFIFSDFQDGIDPDYFDKVQTLVKRRGAKVVFYHPVKFGRDKAAYEAFAKATKGEVKEGL